MKRSGSFLRILIMMCTVTVAMSIIGCGKNKKRQQVSPVATNPAGTSGNGIVSANGACPGCLTDPEFVMAALGKSYVGTTQATPRFELALDFYGERSLGADRNNAAVACHYSGPVVAAGNLHVINPDRMCGMLTGKYTMQTTRNGVYAQGAGQQASGIVGNMTLTGVHEGTGRTVNIQLVQAAINGTCDINQVRAQGIDGSFRFALQVSGPGQQVVILDTNGQPCGESFAIE